MSNLGCPCGQTISDGTDHLPYKGYVLRDVHNDQFFGWVAAKIAGYLEASRRGATAAWFKEQGYGRDYANLKLSEEDIINDLVHSRFCQLERVIYECEACGRIHFETSEDNRFRSYTPDNGTVNNILTTSRDDD